MIRYLNLSISWYFSQNPILKVDYVQKHFRLVAANVWICTTHAGSDYAPSGWKHLLIQDRGRCYGKLALC